MRIFYAITFTKATKKVLNSYTQNIKKDSFKGKFTLMDNLHLTLEFIGEVNSNDIYRYKKILKKLPRKRLNLKANTLGRFKKKGGDIVWVGIKNNPSLITLVSNLIRELSLIGHYPQFEKYTPHITLGRGISIDSLTSFTKSFDLEIYSIALMESTRIDNILIYKPVYELKFIE